MNDEYFQGDRNSLEPQLERFGSVLGMKVSLRDDVLRELSEQSNFMANGESRAIASLGGSSHSPNPLQSHRYGELTMTQKISFGSLAALLLLSAVIWFNLSTNGVSFAQVVENVRNVTSYQASITGTVVAGRTKGQSETGTWYWRAPFAFRMEHKDGYGKTASVSIRFRDKPGIEWNNQDMTYREYPPRQGAMSPLMVLQDLGKYQAAAQLLGEKTIDGVRCVGFQIPTEEVDPSTGEGTLTVWVAEQSQLPEQITIRMLDMEMSMNDFEWNLPLDESLFSVEPPAGYTLRQPGSGSPKTDEEKLAKIVEALAVYAELSNGDYPKVKVVYGDVTRDKLFELAGFAGRELDDEVIGSDKYRKVMDSTMGWALLNEILMDNPDASYHGIEVDSKDKDQVLLRWKLPDGSYQVIYGDLRTATEWRPVK